MSEHQHPMTLREIMESEEVVRASLPDKRKGETMDGLIEGRIAHYVLTESDVQIIKERRSHADNIPIQDKLKGVQYFQGNSVEVGQPCPMMIVKVWSPSGTINGKVFLDGADDYWVTSRQFSEEPKPGTWHWIEKA